MHFRPEQTKRPGSRTQQSPAEELLRVCAVGWEKQLAQRIGLNEFVELLGSSDAKLLSWNQIKGIREERRKRTKGA